MTGSVEGRGDIGELSHQHVADAKPEGPGDPVHLPVILQRGVVDPTQQPGFLVEGELRFHAVWSPTQEDGGGSSLDLLGPLHAEIGECRPEGQGSRDIEKELEIEGLSGCHGCDTIAILCPPSTAVEPEGDTIPPGEGLGPTPPVRRGGHDLHRDSPAGPPHEGPPAGFGANPSQVLPAGGLGVAIEDRLDRVLPDRGPA